MNDSTNRQVNCPTCDIPVSWDDKHPHRPFCSERCKLIDFGEWATEKHSIAGDPVFLEEDDLENPLQ